MIKMSLSLVTKAVGIGTGVGGVLGAIKLGRIGVAYGGSAFGLPGAIAGGIVGAAIGGVAGSVIDIIN